MPAEAIHYNNCEQVKAVDHFKIQHEKWHRIRKRAGLPLILFKFQEAQ